MFGYTFTGFEPSRHTFRPPHTPQQMSVRPPFFICVFFGVSLTSLTCSKRNRSSTGREKKTPWKITPTFCSVWASGRAGSETKRAPTHERPLPGLTSESGWRSKNISIVNCFTFYFILDLIIYAIYNVFFLFTTSIAPYISFGLIKVSEKVRH